MKYKVPGKKRRYQFKVHLPNGEEIVAETPPMSPGDSLTPLIDLKNRKVTFEVEEYTRKGK